MRGKRDGLVGRIVCLMCVVVCLVGKGTNMTNRCFVYGGSLVPNLPIPKLFKNDYLGVEF